MVGFCFLRVYDCNGTRKKGYAYINLLKVLLMAPWRQVVIDLIIVNYRMNSFDVRKLADEFSVGVVV